jgi:phage tail sheath protein FI
MAELLHPGVYVQEVPSAVRPIQGVGTSTAAFIGIADKGPVPGNLLPTGRMAQPVLITSFTDYTRQFGGFRQDSFLTYAVQAFFENGGQQIYIARVYSKPTGPVPSGPPLLNPGVAGIVLGSGAAAFTVSAANEGAWGNNIWVQIQASSDGDKKDNFKLLVMYGTTAQEAAGNVVESYDSLTYQGSPSLATGFATPGAYARTTVNSRSEYIAITNDFTALPAVMAKPAQLSFGSDCDPTTVSFTGQPAADNTRTGTGLYALDKITDVNIIAIPGQGDINTVNLGMEYCKNQRALQDCFFIGDIGSVVGSDGVTTDVPLARMDDVAPTVVKITDAVAYATSTGFDGEFIDKSAGDYGAIYFPWIYATDPIGSGRNPKILLPPSGFAAGIYARTDNSRGVFKAPAGTEAGLAGALAPYTLVSDVEQDFLNPISVNVMRTVPTAGLVVWGARTIGSDASWRYISVRRMAIFLRVSIYYGIQWAVFEPNDEPLWAELRLNIRSFMLTQFRAGAFQGSTPDDAFFVLCDSTTTTQQDIDNGVVNILVGFAPLKPAEFVVLKLSQKVNQSAQ